MRRIPPIWVPPTGELAPLHDGDVSAAYDAGLRCRPMEETVGDTWAWLQDEGLPEPGRSGTGWDAEAEARMSFPMVRKPCIWSL